MRNLGELPEDLLLKILSSLPTKEAAATSVLSKRWYSLWKQQDVVYVELCENCSTLWKIYISLLSLHYKLKLPLRYHPVFNQVFGKHCSNRGLPTQPEKVDPVSWILFLKDQACSECKEMMHTHKKVTIFIVKELGKTNAIIWTVLEEKQEGQIEYVIRRQTKLNYCISLN